MLVTQDSNHSKYQIQSYKNGEIKINDQIYKQSILIHNNKLITDWRPRFFSDIQINDFQSLFINAPHVFLLGTGEKCHIPDIELLAPLLKAGIGVEFMSSAAACRTYSALSAEGRNVSIGLILD